ncbi:uncharacterized protein LOC114735221 [Neltuma alba]|uniref:uncharacterized protein LOC114717809 n=1 Tax=Neltuma alba TaxID=207710 RepID=UPI0010A59AED|nr:uncharacterized protein LOC114717809 [Prosopis alba]XP_028778729.1 uncharacterized protein LOC114735221 [Prosopis alba]
MWRLLENVKKSSRVADENMVVDSTAGMFGHDREIAEADEGGHHQARGGGGRRRRHGGFSVIIYCILQAPISILSCVSSPHVNGGSAASDGVWLSSSSADHFAHISEMNHLMVSDSMRYAILM